MTADLDEFAMAKLAREMAMNIRNPNAIFADYGISEEDYYELTKNGFFIRAKEQFSIEWNSALSAADRVKLISASYAEEVLPVITRRAMNKEEPLVNVLGTLKQLCQNAGIGDPKTQTSASERFVITINLGADQVEHYDKSIAIDVNDISPEPSPAPKHPPPPSAEEIAADRALSTAMKAKLVTGANGNGQG